MPLTPEQIASATKSPLPAVAQHWPLIIKALEEQGIRSDLTEVAVAATVAVETGCFRPIKERRASRNRQPELWALQERYWHTGYYGRGFVQRTWESAYREDGTVLGLDLVGNPDLLLEPGPAARDLALFFRQKGVARAANAQDWRKVRRLVNGGYNGWDEFNTCVCALLEVLGA